MFGPDYALGACPSCAGLDDGLDGTLVHLNHRDVMLICFSRAPWWCDTVLVCVAIGPPKALGFPNSASSIKTSSTLSAVGRR